jgi:hypothetical protein
MDPMRSRPSNQRFDLQTISLVAITVLISSCGTRAMAVEEGNAPEAELKAEWVGNYKILKYKGREFIAGVRNGADAEFPLVGTRILSAPVYANAATPMTIQSQDSYVVYDKTKQKLIVYNIAVCLKGKDESNSEKTDWVGAIVARQDQWAGDIIFLRKYDKKGPGIKAPYFSMGRDYPISCKADGTVDIDYDYFGRLKLNLASREVKNEVLKKIIDDFDAKYREKSE